MSEKRILSNACLILFLAILFSAFAAHGLKSYVQDEHLIADFLLGGQYQIYHGLALLGLGLWAEKQPARRPQKIALAFYLGIFFFSGSLYLLGVTGIRSFGAITPIGGLCFLAGWLLWALESRRK